MINSEVIKEFLRDAYNKGAPDLGVDRKFLEGFLRIFAGEQKPSRLSLLRHTSMRMSKRRFCRWRR
ncbi:hypothetical protein AGR1B_pAt30144 [Agrobacterium fabacearum S56]|uniref:hypothetical protein n=1 Tax=Agrobacterium tumefaciens TaxID=358 RepID=UPI0009BC2C2A|nr:hypothetical protein [Agrobacterium tumefaciens]AYM14312.1 hypothetical protein At1D1108_46860 [Agrobacterium tumefaciens]NSY93888.1 hypothetical protein [Agrobacterium tumefaciens]CUX05521.1 hypothetical protein AGR1B_pAt30144 [Agrobacterium fabacearum S56]